MITCPACGHASEGAKFCPECGVSLAAEAAPAREERKVVTVLFADLAGFTSKAEQMDPEDVRALLGPYHARLREELERFGGTVEKFIGDAVMALFGAPLAHEDDPERAVRAAIAIRDWMQEQPQPLDVRIAVNTGEALVSLDARPERGEAMASGDVVNTTARMQAAAPVNGILVGETTYRATRHVIDYRDAAAVSGKGKAEPIPVWEALTPRARVGVDVQQSGRTPLVGRERELGLLLETAKRVREAREPQLVTLVGVPGIGKSRLTFELFEALERDGEAWIWRQGRCLPYGEGATFWPLGEIVKSHAQIFESDSAGRADEKLSRAAREVIEDATEAEWVERELRPLVGLGADGRAVEDTAASFSAWRRFLEALAEAAALVLVIEDLHWADDAMLEFVDELVDWSSDVPILVLATARPEFLERRPDWGGGKANATTLSLAPLSDEETARLLTELLQRPVLEADTQQALLGRAGGNPLYAEQYAQMFLERGELDEVALPETIQGLIAARLDQLPADEKALLQDASVHGKVFWAGALPEGDATAVNTHLHGLERKQFVRRQRRSSVAGETEFTFRHMLVRDVAYGQIPRATRSEKHRRAAEWIESLTTNRDDHVELLAEHYARALELAVSAHAATPELETLAKNAFRDAGDRAESLGAFGVAETYFARSLELCEPADRERPELLLRLGRSRSVQDRGGLDELIEASAAFLAAGRRARAAEAEAHIGQVRWNRAQMREASNHFDRAIGLARNAPDSREKAHVLDRAARLYLLTLRLEEARDVVGDAVALCERAGFRDLLPGFLCMLGHSRLDSGDSGGIDDVERSLAVGHELPAALQASVGFYGDAGIAYLELGDLDRAFELWDEHRAVARASGNPSALSYGAVADLRRRYYTGDWDGAFRSAAERLEDPESSSPYFEVRPRTLRALMQVARGNSKEALEDAERALELGRGAQDAQTFHTALAVHSHVAWAAGDEDVAQQSAVELLALIAKHGTQQLSMSLPVLADCVPGLDLDAAFHEALAAIRKATPWVDAARARVSGDTAAAAEIYGRIGSRPDEARAHLRAAQQLAARGNSDADLHGQSALAFYRSVGATRYVREAEALLAAAS